MSFKSSGTIAGAIVVGLIYFGVLMGAAIGIIGFNASATPTLVWFPLPVTALLVLAIWLAKKYWGIGLDSPLRTLQPRVYALGIVITLFGIAACAVQGKFSGYVRATELYDGNVSAAFRFTYAVYMAVFAAVLAEVTFRGVMQSRLQQVLSVWPLVILISVVNVFAHRWGAEITQNGFGLFAVLAAWTYLRWATDSLWPPMVMHAVVNLIVALGLWYGGPLAHGETPDAVVIGIAVIGIACLILGLRLGKRVHSN